MWPPPPQNHLDESRYYTERTTVHVVIYGTRTVTCVGDAARSYVAVTRILRVRANPSQNPCPAQVLNHQHRFLGTKRLIPYLLSVASVHPPTPCLLQYTLQQTRSYVLVHTHIQDLAFVSTVPALSSVIYILWLCQTLQGTSIMIPTAPIASRFSCFTVFLRLFLAHYLSGASVPETSCAASE